jgi:uncharacterized protein YndB with AHSA1/START domain
MTVPNQIEREILIDAPVAKVWAAVTGFDELAAYVTSR